MVRGERPEVSEFDGGGRDCRSSAARRAPGEVGPLPSGRPGAESVGCGRGACERRLHDRTPANLAPGAPGSRWTCALDVGNPRRGRAYDALQQGKQRTCPPTPTDAQDVPYPALTHVDARDTLETREIIGARSKKRVSMNLERLLDEPVEIATRALAAAQSGAKVLVIRNTVTSAQDVFNALLGRGGQELTLKVEQNPALHHSRFAVEDRVLLDDAVEEALGKNRKPGGVVVIGTQTLEQSLDIDADLLISDICPVDVLLQRIGRLHRHERADRSPQFREPSCMVVVPEAGLESGLDGKLPSSWARGIGSRGAFTATCLFSKPLKGSSPIIRSGPSPK